MRSHLRMRRLTYHHLRIITIQLYRGSFFEGSYVRLYHMWDTGTFDCVNYTLVCKMNEEEEETKKQTIQHNEVRPSCLLFHHTIHTASSRDSFNGTIITADRPTDRPNDSMTCIAVIPFLLHRKPLLAMFMLKQEFFGLFLLCIVKCTPPNLPSSYQFEATVRTTWTGKSPIVRSD